MPQVGVLGRVDVEVPAASSDFISYITLVHPEDALDAITQTYAPSRLDVVGRDEDFNFQMHVARVPGLAFTRVRFGTDVRVTAIPPSCYALCLATKGRLSMTTGKSTHVMTGSSGVIMYPHEPTYFEDWSQDAELLSVRIDKDLVERQVTNLLGRPADVPVRFDPAFDLSSTRTASLGRTLEMLRTELTQADGIAYSSHGATLLAELVTTSLVLSQPNSYSDLLHQPVQVCPPGPLRAAQDLVAAEPMSCTTVGYLASQVHVSVRSLEEGFKKHLDTSPMAFVRQVRLQRAREDLMNASPATSSVTHVAERWGFRHLGRFASAYRASFGELPAETLRSRSRHR